MKQKLSPKALENRRASARKYQKDNRVSINKRNRLTRHLKAIAGRSNEFILAFETAKNNNEKHFWVSEKDACECGCTYFITLGAVCSDCKSKRLSAGLKKMWDERKRMIKLLNTKEK